LDPLFFFLGGDADASDYLLGVSRFNNYLFNGGVWLLNDLKSASKAGDELPSLCAYLLKPEHCLADTCWGVLGYLHHELYDEAKSSGQSASFQEILSMYYIVPLRLIRALILPQEGLLRFSRVVLRMKQ